MLVANAIRKLERSGFIVCDETPFIVAKRPGGRYIVELCRNGGEYRGEVATIRVRGVNERDDIGTDYFAGTWCDSLAQAIRFATSW